MWVKGRGVPTDSLWGVPTDSLWGVPTDRKIFAKLEVNLLYAVSTVGNTEEINWENDGFEEEDDDR